MRLTNRGITVLLLLIVAALIGILMLMGDPCDSAPNPTQCKIQFNER